MMKEAVCRGVVPLYCQNATIITNITSIITMVSPESHCQRLWDSRLTIG